MTQEERGGIVVIYSRGVKTTLKARKAPMETTVAVNNKDIHKIYVLDYLVTTQIRLDLNGRHEVTKSRTVRTM